jgi:hypothetical protein
MYLAMTAMILIGLATPPIATSAQSLDSTKIDQILGRAGQKTDDVYKVGFPRTDLHVVVEGISIKSGLALGSWAAFSGTDDNAMVMGDLVLLQSEVNPVMQKLRAEGFDISAVHNHLLGEEPHVMYMHYMARGPAAKLADSLKAALAWSKTPLGKVEASAEPATPPDWVKGVEDSAGRKGTFKGGVLSFGIPRAQPITDGGMTFTGAQGVAESINFQDAGGGRVATTGDFVLIADEVNPVISALDEHHFAVTALHNHLLREEPRIFFMHFWAVGAPSSVGAGISAALKLIAVK